MWVKLKCQKILIDHLILWVSPPQKVYYPTILPLSPVNHGKHDFSWCSVKPKIMLMIFLENCVTFVVRLKVKVFSCIIVSLARMLIKLNDKLITLSRVLVCLTLKTHSIKYIEKKGKWDGKHNNISVDIVFVGGPHRYSLSLKVHQVHWTTFLCTTIYRKQSCPVVGG